MKKTLLLSLILLPCLSAMSLADYDMELWNDPLLQNHNWSYYDTDVAYPHDVDMNWQASGGVGNSGYVSTPLNNLDACHSTQAYWPAYLYDGISGLSQQIDLSVKDAEIRIYVRDIGDPLGTVPFNLQGGQVYFFIGQYLVNGPQIEDDLYGFFYNKTPVIINKDKWLIESVIPVGLDSDWGVIAANDLTLKPGDLFYHPQQWGFAIFPAASTPSGVLGFDSFRIIPEPMTLCLLALGAFRLKKHRG
jgi:hypothetical protein